MEKKQGWITRIVVVVFCMLMCSLGTAEASQTHSSQQISEQYQHSLVTTGQIQIKKEAFKTKKSSKAPSSKSAFYQALKAKLMKRQTNISLQYNGNPKDVIVDINEMLEYIRLLDDKKTSDDADFLMGSITSMGYSVNYGAKRADFQFVIRYTENAKQVQQVNKTVQKALKSLNVNQLSDIGKVKAIHDYVVNLVDYDRTMTDHSAYGGLVASKHTTVCQGYALIMYKMLTDAGIEAHYVTGYAGEAHAWNVVKLDGRWYYLDATWDDPTGGKPILSHEYFLVGSQKLSRDHRTDAVYTKQYKVSKNDYNWEKALLDSKNKSDQKVNQKVTKEEQKQEEDAMARNQFIKNLSDSLDESLDYDDASNELKTLYDLYKKVVTCVVRDLPQKKFKLLLDGDSKFCDEYINTCTNKVEKYILKPCMEYLDSEQYQDDTLALMMLDYTYDELDSMEEGSFANLFEEYAFDAAGRYMNKLSKKYTNKIIRECVKELSK